MLALLLLPIYGFINRLRGSGKVPRLVALLPSGIPFGAVAYFSGFTLAQAGLLAAVTSIGFILWAILGWGKYFPAATGVYNPAEKEFPPSDWLADPVFEKTGNSRLAGMIGMSIRGVMLYPLFIYYGIYVTPWAFVIGLGFLMQGPVYWASGVVPAKNDPIAYAEIAWGIFMGAMLGLVILAHHSDNVV